MKKIVPKLASEVGVRPAVIRDYECHGLYSFVTSVHDDEPSGAQCRNCHSIVWVDPRGNAILSERGPGTTGREYRVYYEDKVRRFLRSLPPCPACGANDYDRLVSQWLARFPDGTELPAGLSDDQITHVDPKTVTVWWLEPDPPETRGQPYYLSSP